MTTTLTPTQATRLAELESEIDDGMATFLRVGQALQEIRDSKLYLGESDSFHEYTKNRFGFGRDQARNIIQATEATESLDDVPPLLSVSAAKELKHVPEDERQAVLDAAKESAGPDAAPTAEDIRQASAETGAVSEAELAVLNGRAIGAIAAQISKAIRMLEDIDEDVPGMRPAANKAPDILNLLNNAHRTLLTRKPFKVCPACEGDGCAQCGNEGWLNRVDFQKFKEG